MRKSGILRKLAAFVIAGSLALSFTGCGGMTLEKLMSNMDTALKKKKMYEDSMIMELEASVTAEGEAQRISVELDMDMQLSYDPAGVFLDMEIDAEAAGEQISETLQVYVRDEDGSMVTYAHIDSIDSWTKTDTEMSSDELFKVNTADKGASAFSEFPENLVLMEKTQLIDNRESYVLSYTLTGAELLNSVEEKYDAMPEKNEMLNGLGVDMSRLEPEISPISAPVTVYVDAETFVPSRIEVEVQNLSGILNSIIDTIMNSIVSGIAEPEGAQASELDVSDMDIGIDVTTAMITVEDIGYKPVEIKPVPEEGVEAADSIGAEDIETEHYAVN